MEDRQPLSYARVSSVATVPKSSQNRGPSGVQRRHDNGGQCDEAAAVGYGANLLQRQHRDAEAGKGDEYRGRSSDLALGYSIC